MEMPDNKKKALIIAFYLSKFDSIAYKNLGIGTQAQTHEYIGKALGIKPATIKNYRDEFDPYEDNSRVGWHQKEARKCITKIKMDFDNIEEYSLQKIVKEFLSGDDETHYLNIVSNIKLTEDNNDNNEESNKVFSVQMAKTGKLAEEYFKQNYITILKKYIILNGENHQLIDTRLNGCGYDYEIILDNKKLYIEIKGAYDNSGNIRFTDKEWSFANVKGNEYFLVVIKNISEKPYSIVIQNPAQRLNPEMNVQHVIQVSWITNIDD